MIIKKISGILLSAMLLTSSLFTINAKADAIVGESIYTLGKNLTNEQKNTLLKEMGYNEGEQIIYVTNEEEHKFLGGIIPAAKIGTRAISSSKITMAKENTGIIVSTKNISWVTPEMYTNALVTAGVKDAEIYITAPFSVSGTAALTGLMKAYESSTGNKIDTEMKKVANEEMVTTAELGDEIGTEQANNLMTNVKNTIAEEKPKTEEEIQTIVEDVANQLDIPLENARATELAALFHKMDQAGVDWNSVKDQIDIIKDKWGDKFQEVSQGFFEKIGSSISDFFSSIWNAIVDFFTSIFDKITGSSSGDDSNNTPDEPKAPASPSDETNNNNNKSDNNTDESTTNENNQSTTDSSDQNNNEETSTPSDDNTSSSSSNNEGTGTPTDEGATNTQADSSGE